MIEHAEVTLACCEVKAPVQFRHFEAPVLPANQFRKNVICPSCGNLVIVTMTKAEGETIFEQEIIES